MGCRGCQGGSNELTYESLEQVDYAMMAIVKGGMFGNGAGKSVMKNVLPESTSDFIFAIIVEEYGLIIGALGLMLCYLILLFRIILIATKAKTYFARLIVIAVGLPIR